MVVCNYEYDNENNTVKVNCLNCIYGASIEDFPICMARTIDKLIESKNAGRVILTQTREFEYDMYQTHLLKQIANAILYLVKQQRILSVSNLSIPECKTCVPQRNELLHKLLTVEIREDPIGAYVKAKREIRHVNEKMKSAPEKCQRCYKLYRDNVLVPIITTLESTELINRIKPQLVGFLEGNRALYREIFHPMIKPNFMLTRYMLTPPKKGKKIDRYMVGTSEVQIFKVEDKVQKIYHIIPPEFRLGEDEYTILDAARRYMAAHKPTKTEFTDPQRMRDIFTDIGRDLISELADHANITLSTKTLNTLSDILTRYTAGYGTLEVILGDENVQDIYLNAPMGDAPIYLYHGDHEECITNIIPTREDANAWATRFRIESGRPLDEANPV
ncbi:MAG: hypothetical protein KAI51_03420, partial [Candidatus Aenigmarchaeota archaeon]|nr:hypothetical protein [Candidatus Aenigmarchaeota archaeon]